MEETKSDITPDDRANRVALIFGAGIELLTVGALAILAAYNDFWQLVIITLAYVAYVAFKLWYDLRKAQWKALTVSDGEQISKPLEEQQRVRAANSQNEFKFIKSTPRKRKLAGLAALAYAALMALAFYLESIKIEDRWPLWLLWVGGVLGFATLLLLPFVVVVLFIGIDVSFLRRFSLRGMLRTMFWASLFIWYGTQMNWLIQRHHWRTTNRASIESTKGEAPPVLRLLNEQGESRIEIKNASKEQLAEAKRLFPEATIVATENLPTQTSPNPPRNRDTTQSADSE